MGKRISNVYQRNVDAEDQINIRALKEWANRHDYGRVLMEIVYPIKGNAEHQADMVQKMIKTRFECVPKQNRSKRVH